MLGKNRVTDNLLKFLVYKRMKKNYCSGIIKLSIVIRIFNFNHDSTATNPQDTPGNRIFSRKINTALKGRERSVSYTHLTLPTTSRV